MIPEMQRRVLQYVHHKMTTITFDLIDIDYCIGNNNGFKITIMLSNGYVNASKLCRRIAKLVGVRKPFTQWLEDPKAWVLIDAMCSSSNQTTESFIRPISQSTQRIKGTYVHPDLVSYIAYWASPRHAIITMSIVNKYMSDQHLRTNDIIMQEHINELEKLRTLVTTQSDRIQSQIHEINKLVSRNKKMRDKLDRTTDSIGDVDVQRVDGSSYDDASDKCVFAIIKNNDDDTPSDKRYHVIRAKRTNFNTAVSTYADKCNDSDIIFQIEYNLVNIWDVMKRSMQRKIKYNINDFGLMSDYTERDLKRDVLDIYTNIF